MSNKNIYCIFYKSRGKWVGPLRNEFLSIDDIIFDSNLEKENEPNYKHIKSYLMGVRKFIHKPVKLMKQKYIKV
jgi:hypothetical protein